MKITVITIGTRMPQWVTEGYHEYINRLPNQILLTTQELALQKRTKNCNVTKLIQAEGISMLAAIPPGDHVIALDVTGKSLNTESFSERLGVLRDQGRNLSLLIGGPDGLAPECVQRAHERWSLSPLTLPHPLVRVVLAEQLYRAVSIWQQHPYHR